MKPLLFPFPGNEDLGQKLLRRTDCALGEATLRRFPDGESYVRIQSDVRGKAIYVLCTLRQPDDQLMMLYFFAQTAKQLGAKSVTLIAPYLAYMRQDKAFQPGEAVSSDLFGRLLSGWVDALVTIDPHLHRHQDLSEIYRIPTSVLHATPLIVDYLSKHVPNPIVIGPDAESKQWVAAVAAAANCGFSVLQKERFGDREVKVSLPDAARLRQHTPVLVDDIISTGRTMIETAAHLRNQGISAPVCIGVHAVFAGDALREMRQAGIQTIITTNTIPHLTNELDVSGLLADNL
jgi:ribose-phosphate pyrophosphokinase